jgi:uncharacterized membrane protein YjdF
MGSMELTVNEPCRVCYTVWISKGVLKKVQVTGESAEAFLGTQGYVWDTQSDMALALLGAILSLVALSKIHDRQIRKLSD